MCGGKRPQEPEPEELELNIASELQRLRSQPNPGDQSSEVDVKKALQDFDDRLGNCARNITELWDQELSQVTGQGSISGTSAHQNLSRVLSDLMMRRIHRPEPKMRPDKQTLVTLAVQACVAFSVMHTVWDCFCFGLDAARNQLFLQAYNEVKSTESYALLRTWQAAAHARARNWLPLKNSNDAVMDAARAAHRLAASVLVLAGIPQESATSEQSWMRCKASLEPVVHAFSNFKTMVVEKNFSTVIQPCKVAPGSPFDFRLMEDIEPTRPGHTAVSVHCTVSLGLEISRTSGPGSTNQPSRRVRDPRPKVFAETMEDPEARRRRKSTSAAQTKGRDTANVRTARKSMHARS